MQGLYKKVLRGIYPKIPNIFSNDLAQTIKYLVQVAPQMRPSCDKILEMPIVRKKIEKLFPNEIFDDPNAELNLLSTIRVPKNLLYLTDRLPKPQYDSDERRRREQEELLRWRTYEGTNKHHAENQSNQDRRGPSDKRSKITTNDVQSINSGQAQQLTSSIGNKSKKLRKNS